MTFNIAALTKFVGKTEFAKTFNFTMREMGAVGFVGTFGV